MDESNNWEVLSEKAANELSTLISHQDAVNDCVADLFVLFMSTQKKR